MRRSPEQVSGGGGSSSSSNSVVSGWLPGVWCQLIASSTERPRRLLLVVAGSRRLTTQCTLSTRTRLTRRQRRRTDTHTPHITHTLPSAPDLLTYLQPHAELTISHTHRRCINKVTLRGAWLVLGWLTVFSWVYHLGI